MKQTDIILHAEQASVGYRGKVLIGGISFSVGKGEILTLVGPNGAGKSTILKSLTNQLELISGHVVVCGKDLKNFNAPDLAEHVSVLLTEKLKDGYMTAFDVAAMGRYPYTGRMGILSDRDREITRNAMKALETDDFANKRYSELSDGQKQRVLLARALAQEPEVLVLDEPMSYLDIRYRMHLADLLRDLSRQRGMTVILSLHEMEEAAKLSDRILAIRKDRTVKLGTPEEIFGHRGTELLFDLDPGRYDPLLGSSELKKPEGKPEVFVVSSGGKGIPVYRKLVRNGIPFAAGILYENDLDTGFARRMASEVITEKAFYPISEQTFRRAVTVMSECKRVIDTGIEPGPFNGPVAELLREAKRMGKPVVHGI